MKQDEYINTIVYNGRMINVGLSDAGQTYFIEYVEDGELKEECVGSYIADYEDYIEWRFGEPEINCPIYNDVITTDTECCPRPYRPFCDKCRKRWNDVDYAAWQKRNEEFAKWLKENNNESN
jgi:hypothetical protein